MEDHSPGPKVSIPLGDLVSHFLSTGGPDVLRKWALSKNSGSNPVLLRLWRGLPWVSQSFFYNLGPSGPFGPLQDREG